MWERLREDASCLVLAIAVFCNLMLYPMPVKIVRQSFGLQWSASDEVSWMFCGFRNTARYM